MFDVDDFVATMNDVVFTAEENDIGMWELVDIAANYIDEKLGGSKMKKIYSLKEHKEFEKAAESIIFEAIDNEREVPIIISVGDVSVELPMCADYWNEMCFALKECYEVENGELAQTTGNTKESVENKESIEMCSKLEKDERGFWHYTSKSGVVYDVDESSADINIITDVFGDYEDMLEDCWGMPQWKLVDYVCGDLNTDTNDIKKWIDNRIEFYEQHERTIKFIKEYKDGFYKVYLGSKNPIEWNIPKEISVKEMHKMFDKDRKLTDNEAVEFIKDIWLDGNDKARKTAKEIVDKMYDLKISHECFISETLFSVDAYIRAFENSFYFYNSMDELIEDEFERGGWEEDKTLGDVAKWCYETDTIFRLSNGCVLQYV